jgi:putative two-component system response regulator
MVYRVAAKAMPQDTILIADDSPQNLTVLGEVQHECYRVRAANSGTAALALGARLPLPDLIPLEPMMPALGRFQLLDALRADAAQQDVPAIFTTAMDGEDEEPCLRRGAVDNPAKPQRPAIMLSRVGTHPEPRSARDLLCGENMALATEVAGRRREILHLQEVTMRALAQQAETHDRRTGNHLLRTQAIVEHMVPLAASQIEKVDQTVAAESARRFDPGLSPRFPAHIDEFCTLTQQFPDDCWTAP